MFLEHILSNDFLNNTNKLFKNNTTVNERKNIDTETEYLVNINN